MSKFTNTVKGRIKQAAGALTGNKELRQEGERDEREGRLEGAIEGVKGAVKDVKNAVADATK